ncbi:MAG: hypothetical protein IPF57_22845 [Gammaproteobacteria bacterium]|nr:hypothetical protein [Gammaproteobacteria bacterium]
MAEVCARVPRYGATSFYEALQSMTSPTSPFSRRQQVKPPVRAASIQFLNLYHEEDLKALDVFQDKSGKIFWELSRKGMRNHPHVLRQLRPACSVD